MIMHAISNILPFTFIVTPSRPDSPATPHCLTHILSIARRWTERSEGEGGWCFTRQRWIVPKPLIGSCCSGFSSTDCTGDCVVLSSMLWGSATSYQSNRYACEHRSCVSDHDQNGLSLSTCKQLTYTLLVRSWPCAIFTNPYATFRGKVQ